MSASQLSHPHPNQLASFASGQAPEAEASAISAHLADCAACRTVIDTLPDDTLLSLLRKPPVAAADERPLGRGPEAPTVAITVPSDGAPPGPELPPELMDHPRYHVLEPLGAGGMGAVYKAEHRLMERLVALKMISPRLTTRPALVERFRREVKAAARLSHANIVTAYDADQAGAAHFLIMEYVPGVSLAEHVTNHGPLPVAAACDYVRQAALGLHYAAEQGMVHRDVKPHNLMLTPDGQVKILDFGLARLVREEVAPAAEANDTGHVGPSAEGAAGALTEAGSLMGTADFIAPEQAEDPRRADTRADLYSLGCTLYYLLAGRTPFPGGTVLDKLTAHRERQPDSLTKLRGDVPAALAAVLDRLLAKDPNRRYQTAAEVAEALHPFTAAAVARRRRLRRGLAGVAAALVTAALLGAVIYVQTDNGELVIETQGDKVAVLLGDQGVRLRDEATNREYLLRVGRHRLHPGQYRLDVKELPQGVEFSTEGPFTLRRGDRQVVVVRLNPKRSPEYLRADALGWFPADATDGVGAGNMEVLPAFWRQQLLVFKETSPRRKRWMDAERGDRFGRLVDALGSLERLACAYVRDPQDPERSRLFLRFSGDIWHQRLVGFFRREWTGLAIEESVVDGVPVTVIYDAQPGSGLGAAFALIGTTDFISADYAGKGPAFRHVELIRQCLELRAGRGTSLGATCAKLLEEVPPDAWAYGVGQFPEFGRPQVPYPVTLARSALLTLSGADDVTFRFRGTFGSHAEVQRFLMVLHLMKLGAQGAPLVTGNPELAAAVARAADSLRTEVQADRVTATFVLPGVAMAAIVEKQKDLPVQDINAMPAFTPKKPQ